MGCGARKGQLALGELKSFALLGLAICGLTARPALAQNDSDIVVAQPQQVTSGVWLISGALRPTASPTETR